MKFQFKEGQWFDVRKLTDWQKQWCLDNLDWVSERSKSFINCKDLYITYCNFHPLLKGMVGMSSEWCDPENEITFNDFYWEDEESFDNLVYVEPKHIDNDTYYVVEKDKLSEDQWEFLLSNLPTEEECLGDELFLNLSPRTRKWFDEVEKSRSQDVYISFNDIFKEVE